MTSPELLESEACLVHGRCLYLIGSPGGFKWRPLNRALVAWFAPKWDSGVTQRFDRLEVPKLRLDIEEPRALFLAARPARGAAAASFIVAISLGGLQ